MESTIKTTPIPENEKATLAAAALKAARAELMQALADEEKASQGIAECLSQEAKLAEIARPEDTEAIRALSDVRTRRELFERDRAAATARTAGSRRALHQAISRFMALAGHCRDAAARRLNESIRAAEARARQPFAAEEKRLSGFDLILRDNAGYDADRHNVCRNSERLLEAWQDFSSNP